jgi:branched-chain amino acid aminotransferase
MTAIPHLDAPAFLAARRRAAAARDEYYAFYSSVVGGIVTDPALMLVPADDHLAHRGDGVFETLKCVNGGIYLWREHARRLFHSADAIGLPVRWSEAELADIVAQTVRAGGRRDALIRVILARGPGSMGINPYDCPVPALYVMAHALRPSFMDVNPNGARLVTSGIPVKAGFFATIKSCNYLPNALLKKAAVDAGADFAVAFDERGFVAEGATENIGIVDAEGLLRAPGSERILTGTTMSRVFELADALVRDGRLRGLARGPIAREELERAREILIFGTTPDVTAAVALDGRAVGDGRPGPIALALLALLREDIRMSREHRLEVFHPPGDPT